MDVFRERIKKIAEEVITSDTDFESSYSNFKGPAEDMLNELAPLKITTVNKKVGPKWIDADYKKAGTKRRKLEKLWRRTKTEQDHQQYIDQRNICAQLSLTKQQAFFSSAIESSSKSKNPCLKS